MSDKDKFLLYPANDGAVKVEVLYKEESVWLTQKRMAGFAVCSRTDSKKPLRSSVHDSSIERRKL